MRLLAVPIQRQRVGLCGPAALAAVLRFHGDRAPLGVLVRLCRATPQRGTTPENLARAARARGFRVRVQRWAELRDLRAALRKRLPPIVLWFSGDEGHYSIVVGLNRHRIALADPELGGIRRMPPRIFRRVWFDFSTSSGPEPGATLYARWMLVVEPGKNRSLREPKQTCNWTLFHLHGHRRTPWCATRDGALLRCAPRGIRS